MVHPGSVEGRAIVISPVVPDSILDPARLDLDGSTTWGHPIPYDGPGVYIVGLPESIPEPPIDDDLLNQWLARLPGLTVDGERPTVKSIRARLASFWIPDTSVLYVGRAGTSVARRVAQYYRTPLGDRAPHAGGHWLKTLRCLPDLIVSWARTNDPSISEARLLDAFGRAIQRTGFQPTGGGPILPFANLQTSSGVRKPHGISGSRAPRPPSNPGAAARSAQSRPPRRTGRDLAAINAALQTFACASSERRVAAVPAAAELDRLGVLSDSDSRPGKPLRDLLRRGLIDHAYQEAGRFWFIECAGEP